MVSKVLLLLSTLLYAWVQASPEISSWQTSNGARVYFVAALELPIIDISVVFDAGSARDEDLPGTAFLTNSMLNKRTNDLNTDAIASAFASVGAQFSSSAERDMAMINLRSLTDGSILESPLTTFTEVLTSPCFPKHSFKRLQNWS